MDNYLTQEIHSKVKEIGKKGICSETELIYFLPNYPVLRGSEFIFTIGWANARKFIDSEIEYFIKGLHYIELKYREKQNNDFGFGSPSPTFMVISKLKETDNGLSLTLSEWVKANGGNYYLKKT